MRKGKGILIFFLFFLAAVLEVSFFPNFFPQSAAPGIVLVMIVILSSRIKFEKFWIWAMLAGFIVDIMTFSPIGMHAASFLLVSLGISFISKRFFVTPKTRIFFTVAVLVLGSTIIDYFFMNILSVLREFLLEQKQVYFSEIFNYQKVLLGIVSNLIIFSLIYWPVSKLKNSFLAEENKLSIK